MVLPFAFAGDAAAQFQDVVAPALERPADRLPERDLPEIEDVGPAPILPPMSWVARPAPGRSCP